MIFKGDGWRVVALGLIVGRSVNILLFYWLVVRFMVKMALWGYYGPCRAYCKLL